MSVLACAQLVERGDPDRFLAAMAAPVEARAILFPIYAYNLEVSRAPWVTEEAMIAEMRLQFWRDVAEEIEEGKPPRAHEVASPLAARIAPQDGPLLDGMAQARRWDIYKDAFEDQGHFDDYLEDTAGNMMWLAAKSLAGDAGDGAFEGAVRGYAWASGLANYLRAIPDLEARGRVPLLDGTPQALRELASRGLAKLTTARRAARAAIPPQARAAVVAGWQAEAILKQVLDNPLRVSEGTLGTSEFSRRARLLWVSATGRV